MHLYYLPDRSSYVGDTIIIILRLSLRCQRKSRQCNGIPHFYNEKRRKCILAPPSWYCLQAGVHMAARYDILWYRYGRSSNGTTQPAGAPRSFTYTILLFCKIKSWAVQRQGVWGHGAFAHLAGVLL